MTRLSQSSQMKRIVNEVVPFVDELNRLVRSGKPVEAELQKLIDRLSKTEPDEVDINSCPPASSPTAAPDPGLAAVLEKLAQMEQTILDRLSRQPQAQAAPAEITNTSQLIEQSGIPFGQLAAQARTAGEPLEKVLERRTGYRHIGSGNFIRQR
ncbi:hypothetical protein [Leptolyngbya ohadii]|uniref:hypothetical protein n=1 Tax=Leptolyngbya ohadii TaxID=1962290 RepID=UPI000B59A061|nr:hypothetical protein [Leptolyngbya ohadii]